MPELKVSDIKAANPQKTANGELHGLVKVVSNSVPDSGGKRFKEKDREVMKKKKEHEGAFKKVTYMNMKGNLFAWEHSYCNWDGDPILTFRLLPNHDYDIPVGLIEMTNIRKEKKRSGLLDQHLVPLEVDSETPYEHRFVAVGI